MTEIKQVTSQLATKRKTPITWPEEAVQTLLKLLGQCSVIQLIDGRRVRNSKVYEKIAEEMMTHGFKYTRLEIRNKWKNMKKNYFDTKRKLSQSGASSNALNSTFFMMDKLLSTRPRAEALTGDLAEGLDASDNGTCAFPLDSTISRNGSSSTEAEQVSLTQVECIPETSLASNSAFCSSEGRATIKSEGFMPTAAETNDSSESKEKSPKRYNIEETPSRQHSRKRRHAQDDIAGELRRLVDTYEEQCRLDRELIAHLFQKLIDKLG